MIHCPFLVPIQRQRGIGVELNSCCRNYWRGKTIRRNTQTHWKSDNLEDWKNWKKWNGILINSIIYIFKSTFCFSSWWVNFFFKRLSNTKWCKNGKWHSWKDEDRLSSYSSHVNNQSWIHQFFSCCKFAFSGASACFVYFDLYHTKSSKIIN